MENILDVKSSVNTVMGKFGRAHCINAEYIGQSLSTGGSRKVPLPERICVASVTNSRAEKRLELIASRQTWLTKLQIQDTFHVHMFASKDAALILLLNLENR